MKESADSKLMEKLIDYKLSVVDTFKFQDLTNELMKFIKSHYYAKSEVERVIDNSKTPLVQIDWRVNKQETLDFISRKDLKTELQKLGER